MFVVEAWKHVDAELKGTPNAPGQPPANIPAAVEELWLGLRQSKGQSSSVQRFFAAGEVSSSPLAPHLDLQLQLPPQQLLQLLREAGKLFPDGKQQQQVENNDDKAAIAQADTVDVVQQQPQQQQQVGGLPFDVSALHATCQEHLAELLSDWQLALQFSASRNSSSSSSSREDDDTSSVYEVCWLIKMLQEQCSVLLRCMQPQTSHQKQQQQQQSHDCVLAAPSADQQQQQQRQQAEKLPVQSPNSKCTARQHGPQQQQDAANGTLVKISSIFSDTEDDASSTTSSSSSSSSTPGSSISEVDGSVGCASSKVDSAHSDPTLQEDLQEGLQEDEPWVEPAALAQNMLLIAKCLLLQFVGEAWQAGGGAAAAAWQQAVPLQVLLLCGQLQQLDAALDCWVQSANGLLREQRQQVGQEQQDGQEQQQQQQDQHNLHALLQEHKQHQLKVLQQVVALVQSMRQFHQVGEGVNAAAAAAAQDPISAAAAAAGPAASSISSSVEQLAPASFFTASGPLAAGLWGFREPVGAGIWAQIDSIAPTPAAAAAAAGSQQQQQQQLQQQQAWSILFGSFAWQEALRLAHSEVGACFREAPREVYDALKTKVQQLQRAGSLCNIAPEQRRMVDAYISEFEKLGMEGEMTDAVENAALLAAAVVEQMTACESQILEDLGFDVTAWVSREEKAAGDAAARKTQAMTRQQLRQQVLRLLGSRGRLAAGSGSSNWHLMCDDFDETFPLTWEDDVLSLDSDDELELIDLKLQQHGAAGAAANQLAASLAAATFGAGSDGGSSTDSMFDELWDVAPAVLVANASLRYVGMKKYNRNMLYSSGCSANSRMCETCVADMSR
jgi:hypothetical protein